MGTPHQDGIKVDGKERLDLWDIEKADQLKIDYWLNPGGEWKEWLSLFLKVLGGLVVSWPKKGIGGGGESGGGGGNLSLDGGGYSYSKWGEDWTSRLSTREGRRQTNNWGVQRRYPRWGHWDSDAERQERKTGGQVWSSTTKGQWDEDWRKRDAIYYLGVMLFR